MNHKAVHTSDIERICESLSISPEDLMNLLHDMRRHKAANKLDDWFKSKTIDEMVAWESAAQNYILTRKTTDERHSNKDQRNKTSRRRKTNTEPEKPE